MLVLAAVALATTPAFASKARLSALQSVNHITDTRDVLSRPDQALAHGEFATLEVGPTATATRNAEGGFVRKLGDNSAMGAYLGNKLGVGHSAMGLSASYTYTIQNPLNLYYANKMGDMSWGLGLQYSASENKIAKNKSAVMGLVASATSSTWNAEVNLGLTGEATIADTTKVEQSSPLSISGGYNLDSLYIYGGYEMLGAKTKVSGTGTADAEKTTMKVGVIDHFSKDGAHFFYGAEYNSTVTKEKTLAPKNKTETTKLPILVGIEAEAASWLVIRGSIKQSVLMASTKTTPDGAAATTDKSLEDDTVVAGGMGVKLGKFTIDGTLAGAGASQLGLDGNNFMADLGITYKF